MRTRAGPGGAIEKFSPSGADLGVFAHTASESGPIAIDSAGNFYVGELNDEIEIFATNGTRTGVINATNWVDALVFDGAGNLYVSLGQAVALGNVGSVVKYSATGTCLGIVASGLNNAFGLAFDSAGNLYVANTYGHTIEKVTPSGVQSVFADTGSEYPSGIAIATLGLDLKMYAGITLKNGNIGSNYLIQATSNLSSSNWVTLTNVVLPTSPYTYIDYDSPTNSLHFYRAVQQ